jgi:putative transposase
MPIKRACQGSTVIKTKECSRMVVDALDHHLTIPIQGSLNQKNILEALTGIAAQRLSIHSINLTTEQVPCETSFRYHLAKLDLEDLEEINHKILTNSTHTVLEPGKSYQFAIDYTLDPYYGGVTKENEQFIIRSKSRKSTTKFYSYVTLYTLTRNHRITLSVLPVKNCVSKVAYIAQFLDVIRNKGLNVEVLCLDRAFYTKKVFSFLQMAKVPHIVPVRRSGREMKVLLKGRSSHLGKYTLKGKNAVTVDIAVKTIYQRGRSKKHGVKNLGYVVFGINWNPDKVCHVYSSRFAIESSYRMRNEVRPRTTTRNVTIRYLFAIISFLIKNNWVVMLWRYCAPLKRGPKTIDARSFPFSRFRTMIWFAICQKFRLNNEIWLSCPHKSIG